MSKYYYSYFNRKKDKKKFKKKMIFYVTFLLIFMYFLLSLSDQILNSFRIKKIYIQENFTTLPDDLISKTIIDKANIFNYPFLLENVKRKYNEIFKIKVLNIPFLSRELRISILAREYLFYIQKYADYIFYSKDKKWYKIYNSSKFIKDHNIKEVCVSKYLDIDKIYELNELLSNAGLSDKIDKILVKDNKEYVIYFKEGFNLILRENFNLLNKQKISRVYELLNKKVDRIYGSLLDEGIVFYNELH